MLAAVRIALLSIKLVMRTKVALFFTFLFPLVFLFVYSGIFAHGNPQAVMYFFGPVVTLNIMGSSFFGLGLQAVMQRERGSLRRYRLAPLGPGTMVVSSLLANYLLELPTIALLVFCARVIFHMPISIDPLTLLAIVTVGTFAFAGFGLTVASVANTMQEAQVYNNVVWFTLLFLSGATVPLPLLPHRIQQFAAFLPATYLVSTIQSVMLGGQSLLDHRAEILVLLASGTFGLLFAWKLFRWEKEERISTRAKLIAAVLLVPFIVMGLWMNHRGRLSETAEATFSLFNLPATGGPQVFPAGNEIPLEDFEGQNEAEHIEQNWRVTVSAGPGNISLGDVDVISPGANRTGHALRFKGRVGSSPTGGHSSVSIQYHFHLPPEMASLRGLALAVRGDSRAYQAKLIPPDPDLPALDLMFVPDFQWQDVRLPAAWPPEPNSDSPKRELTLEFRADGPSGDFALDLDEIRLY